jgi:hypothetical protein
MTVNAEVFEADDDFIEDVDAWLRGCDIEVLWDDLCFVRQLLPTASLRRDTALVAYVRKWQKAAATEPRTRMSQNIGRKVANTWLRETYSLD